MIQLLRILLHDTVTKDFASWYSCFMIQFIVNATLTRTDWCHWWTVNVSVAKLRNCSWTSSDVNIPEMFWYANLFKDEHLFLYEHSWTSFGMNVSEPASGKRCLNEIWYEHCWTNSGMNRFWSLWTLIMMMMMMMMMMIWTANTYVHVATGCGLRMPNDSKIKKKQIARLYVTWTYLTCLSEYCWTSSRVNVVGPALVWMLLNPFLYEYC